VRQWTGIPVSVGIGPAETLATIANHLATIDPAAAGAGAIRSDRERRAARAGLPVDEVPGIGRLRALRLVVGGMATRAPLS
jgi:DNA polymerase V